MSREQRRRRDAALLDGFVTGPAAATEATRRALDRVGGARTLILVEGVSDQVAVETLAARRGRDLAGERVVIVPIGGAQAIARMVAAFGPAGEDLRLAGLCDAAEEPFFRAALADAGLSRTAGRDDMADAGFHVCVDDLEDELIRALGPPAVEDLFDRSGDLGPFRTLQKQAAWRGRPVTDQMRRFLGAGARRKSRYARLMVEALDADRIPLPLDGVLDHVQRDRWQATGRR